MPFPDKRRRVFKWSELVFRQIRVCIYAGIARGCGDVLRRSVFPSGCSNRQEREIVEGMLLAISMGVSEIQR